MSRKKQILVVDDDKGVTTTIRYILEVEGYEVHTADNGLEALRQLDTLSPDLIILDLKMPRMSGIEFLNEIAGTDGAPTYRVLILTAWSNMESFFDELDVDGFLQKPISTAQLMTEIKRVLPDVTESIIRKRQEEKQLKLLLAEDNPNTLNELLQAFSQEGYTVEHAMNGSDVIGKAVLIEPDIVVMKEILQGMDGHMAAETLRTIPKTKRTPIILYNDGSVHVNDVIEKRIHNIRHLELIETSVPGEVIAAVEKMIKAESSSPSP